MAFIRSREVVDKETGKTHRRYQLVESEHAGGRYRQQVVAHLGEHPTVEDATAKLRNRLRELEDKRDEHRKVEDEHATAIKQTYYTQLEKYHAGRIPTRSEHHGLAWPKPYATEKGRRYMRDFGQVEWKQSSLKKGQTYEAYTGYETFGSWVFLYWRHRRKAAELEARVERLSGKLREFDGLSVTGSDGG